MKNREYFFVHAFLDTLDIKVFFLNEKELHLLIKYSKNFLFEYVILENDFNCFSLVLTINPNNLSCCSYKKVLTTTELNVIFNQIIAEILAVLKRQPLIFLTRIDFCFDSKKDFQDNFSVLYQIFRALIQKANLEKSSNVYSTLDVKTFKKRSLKAKNQNIELSIYDKQSESKHLHDCVTRLEIRRKFLNCEITQNFDFSEVIEISFKSFFSYDKKIFLKTNSNMLLELIKVIEKNKELKFSSFFKKYKDFLNNYVIMTEIAEIYNLKDFKSWKSRYARESVSLKYRNIELFFLELQNHMTTFLEK